MQQNDLLEAALDYARLGWHVFPAHTVVDGKCSCGRSCGTPGKHPMISGGVYAATADPAQVKDWWSRWPQANIGIATGQVSGCFVLDVDRKEGGLERLQELVDEHGVFQTTPTAVTGDGGMHIYCKYPAAKVPNKVKFSQGLDTRGDGGYVIAPPSAHISGRQYEWQIEPVPNGSGRPKLAASPSWLLDLIKEAPQEYTASQPTSGAQDPGKLKYAHKAFDSWRERLAQAQPGGRNSELNNASYALGTYIGAGYLDRTEVETELARIASASGLAADEIRKTLASGIRAGQQRPKDIPDRQNGRAESFQVPYIGVPGETKRIDAQNEPQEADWLQDNNSFPFTSIPLKGETQGNRFKAVPISQLSVDEVTLGWVWFGYAGPQLTTLFTGLWKSGKTTLETALLAALNGRVPQFCGLDVMACKVLVVTEESARKWIERRGDFNLEDHIHMICKPFLKAPTKADWVVFLADLAAQVKEQQYKLVVFDTIFNLWPVVDENDAAQVKEALMPLNMLLEEGAGVFLSAHPKKGDAKEAQATRGTGALPAFVDIIVEMRRYDPEHNDDTRRVLTTYSRYDESPAELVIEYDISRHTFSTVGTKADAKYADRAKAIMRVFSGSNVGYTFEEIYQNWPKEEGIVRPSEATMRRDLDGCCKEGLLRAEGLGIKGDPFRWRRA